MKSLQGDDKCYEYYQQGPCEQDEVVTYDIKTENAVCSLDKCLKKNQESFSDRSISQQDFHRVSGYKDINESLPQNVEEDELFDSEQQISKNNFKQIAELKGKSYAPLNGDGECYKLGSSSICSEYGDQSRFVVDQNIHVPKCSTTNLQLHIIGGTNNCNLDHNGQCKKSVVVMKNQNKYVYS